MGETEAFAESKDRTVWEGIQIGYVSLRDGRSEVKVECGRCGGSSYFTLWSWAGHGKARCTPCGAWVGYQGGKRRDDVAV